MRGQVIFYNHDKRSGFIKLADGRDVFVHKTNIEGGRELWPDDVVELEIGPAPGGRPEAKQVRVVEEAK